MYKYLSFLCQASVCVTLEDVMCVKTHFAVAPTYDSEPTTPTVYRAARERIAGLTKNRGLSVAAWQALKPCSR